MFLKAEVTHNKIVHSFGPRVSSFKVGFERKNQKDMADDGTSIEVVL